MTKRAGFSKPINNRIGPLLGSDGLPDDHDRRARAPLRCRVTVGAAMTVRKPERPRPSKQRRAPTKRLTKQRRNVVQKRQPVAARAYPLVPELVPAPLWELSAKKTLGAAWKRIRQDVLDAARHTCEVCGHEPNPYYGDPLHCHEVWHYDDRRGTATLVKLRMQCKACDSAVHIGRAMQWGAGDAALTQLQKVNAISLFEAERLYAAAMIEWKRRSAKAWRLSVDAPLLAKYPTLARLCSTFLRS